MNILIATPASRGSKSGNRVTAERWAGLLRQLGHKVAIENELARMKVRLSKTDRGERRGGEGLDLLIALHATKTHDFVRCLASRFPDTPIAVCLTGTDLHQDLAVPNQRKGSRYQKARRSLDLASRIISLRELPTGTFTKAIQDKVRVIVQSAKPTINPQAPLRTAFEVSIVGHLRAEKDPFLILDALKQLPSSSKIKVNHYGKALSSKMRQIAEQATTGDGRYAWRGERPRSVVRRRIARSRIMLLTSKIEGGPSVFSEAIIDRTPILATRIAASVSLLGPDYPGLFPVEDAKRLAQLLIRSESDPRFYHLLQSSIRSLRPSFTIAAEKRSLKALLNDLR